MNTLENAFMTEMEGSGGLMSEVRSAMDKMKRRKAARPGGIIIEMLSGEFSIDKIKKRINEIGDICNIPEDLNRASFVALP